ncbi:MAG: NMD3-related protein [archaeon]|jgi:nonsense-mediated mRNA decay protein 3
MSFKKFCPKCGKETDWLIKGKCRDCFLATENIFSIKNVSDKVQLCGRCAKILIQGKWIESSEKAIEKEIESKIKTINDLQEPKIFIQVKKTENRNKKEEFYANVRVMGIIDSQIVEQEKGFVVEIQGNICDPCMRLASDYREAIIQLRTGSKKESEEMLHQAEKLIKEEKQNDPLSAIVKTVKVRNGFDLWVGSKKASVKVSNKLAKFYETKSIVSSKLIGRTKDGGEKYRFTFCVKNNTADK